MANIPDFGTITHIENDRWGERWTGKLDDGRIQRAIPLVMFNKGAGQRFKTIEQYNEEKAEQIKQMQLSFNKTNAI